MNSETEKEYVKEKALKVCKEFLGGPWTSISLEELGFDEVRGGMSNSIYRCFLPENVPIEPGMPKEALLRIYGPIQEDREQLVTEAVVFLLLSERRLGPKLHGVFSNGRLEEFIPSHSLSSDEMRSYGPLIAREMAKIHALDVPVKKIPDMFETCVTKWLYQVQDDIRKDNEEHFMSFDEYRREIAWLIKEMAKTNSPTAYCHNDLQGGNILYREDVTQNGTPNLILIDFEFGHYNYREYDLVNHLCEWCFDYGTPEYPHFHMDIEKFPSREEQLEFFGAYLDQLSEEGIRIKRPLTEELESMLRNVNIFACGAHLYWCVWSVMMARTSTYGFAHREHAKTRKRLYKMFKERYLTQTNKAEL